MQAQLITVQDLTTPGTISATDLFNWIWSLNRQGLFHYGRSPWVERGYAPPVLGVRELSRGAVVPAGVFNIELHDALPEAPEALGLHENTVISKMGAAGVHSMRVAAAPGQVPVGKIAVKTSRADGVDPCEVCSHEMLEGLVDPNVATNAEVRKVKGPNKDFYIVEVGDPVQGCGYPICAPEGLTGGPTVADFVWPRWYGMPQTRPDMSFRDSVRNAFEIAPLGYQSIAPENDPENWTQITGRDAPHVKDPQ